AWLGSDEAGERLVAATVTGPVNTNDLRGTLLASAFIHAYSTTPIPPCVTRSMFSSTVPGAERVYYAPLDADPNTADGVFLAAGQLDQLPNIMLNLKPPTQLLIQSHSPEHLDHVLDILAQQSNASLMRSRHRILANHPLSAQQISQLVTLHASITIVPRIVDAAPKIFAPTASLIAEGVHVAMGTGEWSGALWGVVAAVSERDDIDQRISSRGAFQRDHGEADRALTC